MKSQKVEDIENVPEVSITIPTESCAPEEPIATEQSGSRPLTAKSTTSSGKSAENLSRKFGYKRTFQSKCRIARML